MANELKIRVVFDTGQAKPQIQQLGAEFTQFAGRVQTANKAITSANTPLQQTTRVGANATVTLQALNYTIRDSPYFFRDFSLGILAIGNNLNPLIDGLIRMNTEAKLTGKTLGGSLLQSLKGSAGLVFAFSLLVSIMQAVVFAMAKTKGGADKLTDSLEILKGIISELIEFENPFEKWVFPIKTMDIDRMIEATDAEIKKLKEQEQRSAYQFMVPLKYRDQLKPLTEEEKKRQKLNEELLKTLEEQRLKLEAQKLVAERLKELGIEPISKDKKGKELDISKYGLESLDEFLQKRNEILKSYEDEVKAINKTTASQEKKNIALEKNLSDRDIRLKKLDIEREKEIAEARDKWISSESKRLEDIAEKRASTEEKWNEIIAQRSAKAIEDELTKKIESIKASYLKLYNDLEKEKPDLTPESYKGKKTALGEAEIGEIQTAKIDAAYKAIEERMGNVKSMALSIGDDLFNAFVSGKEGIDSMIKAIPILLAKLALRAGIEAIISGLITTQKEEARALIVAESGLVVSSALVATEMGIIAAEMVTSAGAMTGAAVAMTAAAVAMAAASMITGFPIFSFAQGGIIPKAQSGYIVPGTSYYGDRVPILANSGEMILNSTQQANLFSLLNGGFSTRNMNLTVTVDGQLKGSGSELYAIVNKRNNIVKKYY
uniref:Putative tail tape measure protein n=1 Tax=viral metagenome TaxID=1070528 RepID=A0A6M3M0W5_9ZZZZ